MTLPFKQQLANQAYFSQMLKMLNPNGIFIWKDYGYIYQRVDDTLKFRCGAQEYQQLGRAVSKQWLKMYVVKA